MDLGIIIAYSHNVRHANSFLCGLFGKNFREFSFRFGQGPNFFQYSCTTCKRPCWQWCKNKRNDSQQCWEPAVHRGEDTTNTNLAAILARAWPQQCCKSCSNVFNIVALRFIDHGTKGMLEVVGQHCCVHLHEAQHPRSLALHQSLLFDNP